MTLIEVMLALGLSAVLATALYGVLWTGTAAWKRLRARAELFQTARIVFERLESDLQHEVPITGGGLKDLCPFKGERDQLSFSTVLRIFDPARPSRERPVIARVAYGWKRRKDGRSFELVRNWAAYSPEPQSAVPMEGSEAFPPDVSGISFYYPTRGVQADKAALVWEETWPGLRQIPEGVRVDLSLKQPVSGEELTLRRFVPIWQGHPYVRPAS